MAGNAIRAPVYKKVDRLQEHCVVLRRFFVSTALVPLVFDGDGDDDNGSGDSGAAVRTPLRF